MKFSPENVLKRVDRSKRIEKRERNLLKKVARFLAKLGIISATIVSSIGGAKGIVDLLFKFAKREKAKAKVIRGRRYISPEKRGFFETLYERYFGNKVFMYYHESVFENYESFKKILEEDPTFVDNIYTEFFGMSKEEVEGAIENLTRHQESLQSLREKVEKEMEKEWKKDVRYLRVTKQKVDEKIFTLIEDGLKKGEKGETIITKLESYLFQKKFEQIRDQIEAFHSIQEKLLKRVSSKEYLEKLTIEVNGDRERAKKLQEERIANLKRVRFFLSNFHHWVSNSAVGLYHSEFKYLALSNKSNSYTKYHELTHQMTDANRGIPQETKEKFDIHYSFEKRMTEREKKISRNKFIAGGDYFRNPTEILARKVVFDIFLEELGIKKYGEEFTKEHYEKVKKLEEEGKLEKNASQFFRMFERDSLIMIMNTTAFKEYLETGKLDEEKLTKEVELAILNAKGDTYYPPEFWVNSDTEVG